MATTYFKLPISFTPSWQAPVISAKGLYTLRVKHITYIALAALAACAVRFSITLYQNWMTRIEVRELFASIQDGANPKLPDNQIVKTAERIQNLAYVGLLKTAPNTVLAIHTAAQNRITVRNIFTDITSITEVSPQTDQAILEQVQRIEALASAGLTPEEQAQVTELQAYVQRRTEVRVLFQQVTTTPILDTTLDQIQATLENISGLQNAGLSSEECATLAELNSTLALLKRLQAALNEAFASLPATAIPMRQIGALATAFDEHIPALKTPKKGAIAFVGFKILVDKIKEEFDKPEHKGRFASKYLPMLESAFQAISIAFLGKRLMTPNPQEALAFFKACQSSNLLEGIANLFKISVEERIENITNSFQALPELGYKSDTLRQMQDLECLAAEGLLPEDYQTKLAHMQKVCTNLENAAKEQRCVDLIVGPSQAEGAAEGRNPEELLTAIAELKSELRYESKLIEGVSPAVVAALDLLEKLTHMNRQPRFAIHDFLSLPNEIPLNFFEDQLEGRPIAPYMQALAAPLTECATAAYTKTAVPDEWTSDMVDQLSIFYEWADLLPTKGLPNLSLLIEFGELEDTIGTFNNLSLNDDHPVILPSMVYRLCAMVRQKKKTSINPLPETLRRLITSLRNARGRYLHAQNPDAIMTAVGKLETIVNL